MNKRARLTRRILREHRQGAGFHYVQVAQFGRAKVYGYWACTHCEFPALFPLKVPDAYR